MRFSFHTLLILCGLLLVPNLANATPLTTQPNVVGMTLTPCTENVPLVGGSGGAGTTGKCWTTGTLGTAAGATTGDSSGNVPLVPVPLTDLATIASGNILGNITGSPASAAAISLPSCASDGSHALTNNAGAGLNCTSITGTAASVTVGTTTVDTASGSNYLLTTGSVSGGTGTLANATIASILTAGTDITITGTTNATIALTHASITIDSTTCTLGSSCTVYPALAYFSSYVASPNPGQNSTFMEGYGSACTITPTTTGNVSVTFNGYVEYAGTAGTASATLYYNSGSVPAFGAAVTGNAINATQYIAVAALDTAHPFTVGGIVIGLNLGTAYWFDLYAGPISGSNVNFTLPSCYANEF